MALQGVYGQNMTNYSTPLLGFEVADQAWGLGFVVREFGVRSSGWVGANGITGFHELGLTIGFRGLGLGHQVKRTVISRQIPLMLTWPSRATR